MFCSFLCNTKDKVIIALGIKLALSSFVGVGQDKAKLISLMSSYSLGVVLMHFFQKSIMWASGYDYIAIFKHFLLKKLFMKPYRDIAQFTSIIQGKS